MTNLAALKKVLEDKTDLDEVLSDDFFDKLRERDLREEERKSENPEFIMFDITEEDSIVMKAMKTYINKKNMLRQDFYDYFGPGKGYSIFYAIQTRHDIYGDILVKLLEFLNIEMTVSFR